MLNIWSFFQFFFGTVYFICLFCRLVLELNKVRCSAASFSFQYSERRIKFLTLLTTFIVYVVSVVAMIAVLLSLSISHNWPNISFFNDLPYQTLLATFFLWYNLLFLILSLSVCLHVYKSVYLSVRPSVYLFVYMSVRPSICLSL